MISFPLASARRRTFAFAVVASLVLSVTRLAALPAFPGAEGFGANASGGRGGSVYHVTNLNDSGPGSFRDAVSASRRTVVFDVGGIIRPASNLVVASNVTIAGQTAPGEGICLYGASVSVSGKSNIIIRYLRFRQGIAGDSGNKAFNIGSGANNIILDHCSIEWGRWDDLGITTGAHDITLQYCIIAEGINPQSFGALIDSVENITLSHNLWMSNESRNPKAKGTVQYINNVIYNWASTGLCGGHSAADHYLDVIGNYFIKGPSSNDRLAGQFLATDHVYQSGNFADLNTDGTLNGALIGEPDFHRADETGYTFPTFEPSPAMQPAIPVTIDDATVAFQKIVAEAGCSLHRDAVDRRLIDELSSVGLQGQTIPHTDPSGEALVGGLGEVAGGLAPTDTDHDGMPDPWEAAAATDPLAADNNADSNGDGYTNLETYLDAIASPGGPGATVDDISDDSGFSDHDRITSDTTLKLRGTAASAAAVTISRLDLGAIGTTTADGNGHWVFDYSGTPLADRYYAFQAAVDATPPSAALLVQIKTTPASAPAVTSIVSMPEFAINGTSDPGDRVDVTLDGTGIVGSATADQLGNWSATYTGAPLAPGTYTFTAQAIDLAGNTGPASAPYTVDTSLAAPVFTGIAPETGLSDSDQITTARNLSFSGTAFSAAVVTITRGTVGGIGSTTAAADGTWTFDYTGTTLPEGVHTFSATASSGGIASLSSPPFVVTIDTTRPKVSSIRRQDPATAATTASTLVFRVTFSEPVSGVTAGAFSLTLASGVSGSIASVAAVSSSVLDVTVTGAAGDGTVRLDLKGSGTGIADIAGNAMNTGFTGGQTYTMRLPGSGVWISTESGQLWSDPANWEDGIVANGAGATADFGQLSDDVTVQLDTPRALGRVVFGDSGMTEPALWTLSDNGSATNVLTLDGPTPNLHVNAVKTSGGDTVDVPAAVDSPTTLDLVLAGSAGFTKTGIGTLQLVKPATITGPLTITKGVVQIGPGGSLAPSSVYLATSQQLRIAGGNFSTTGDVTWKSGTGTGIIVSAGTASFQRILPSNTRNSFVRVTGGAFAATEISFPRSGDSESQARAAGVLISGGESTVGTIGLGTDNSWGAMTISGGRLTVTGPVHAGFQVTSGRGGDVVVSGGEFNVSDGSDTGGLILARNPITDSPARANNPNEVANFIITGGVSNIARIALGYDATSTAGSAKITLTNGELNIGSGGIVKGGTSGMVTSITLNSGTLGALAPWSTSHPIVLAGTPPSLALRAATPGGIPCDFALMGELSGSGGFAKTGGGTLTLAGANTFTGSVAIDAGALLVTGSLATGGEIDVNAGGTLAGSGMIDKTVVLNGGTLSPSGSAPISSVTWNAGSLLSIRVGANGVSDQLVLDGALTKGTAGAYPIALSAGSGFAAGNSYTLATFGSTNFVAGDFTATGLPDGYVAIFSVTGTSLQVTVKSVAALALGELTQTYDGTPRSVSATTTPTGLSVAFTYDGSSTPPTLPGTYDVVATIVDPQYAGTASGQLVITITALVGHAFTLSGDIDGSAQVLLGESGGLNSNAGITGDLLVRGLPTVQLNGDPIFGGTLDAGGSATPSNTTITLNRGSLLRHVVRRVDPLMLPDVAAPQAPTGTTDITINSANQNIGDFSTLRNLTLNNNVGMRAVAPGSYGAFSANGGSGFVFGVAGATEPAVYELQSLTLNSGSGVQIVGPVILRLASGLSLNGAAVGDADHPEWLALEIASGGLTLNSGATLRGDVLAPVGTVSINGNTVVHGHVSAAWLTINKNGLLEDPTP